MQRLEDAQERQARERRWEPRRATRHHMHYGCKEEEQDWRVHNYEERRHQHKPLKISFPFVKLPSFNGESDPDMYLGWEAKVEKIFNVYEVEEDQRVKLASVEFLDYAMQWWHQIVMDIGLNKTSVVVSSYDLRECMRTQFVPPHYRKELLLKLQRLHQGPRSVDQYFKDLEVTLTKINIHENEESKIARFVRGLRREIQDILQLYEYSSLKKLVLLVIKVESQIWKKTTSKNTHNDGFYKSSWKDKNKISTKSFPSNLSKQTTSHHRVSKDKPSTSTLKSPTKTSSTKCFKCLGFEHITANCPTKRIMMVKWVVFVSDHSSQSSRSRSPTSSRSQSEENYELPCEGDLLVVRRMLGITQKPFDESQRENIFHTRCLINDKLCSLIVDGGSFTNMSRTRVMDKLGLPIISHTKPYKLKWLSEVGEIIVNKQVLIAFSIGKYKDEVLCDVVPMESTHILFGIEGHGNLIEKFYMMALLIKYLLPSMGIRSF